MAHAFWASFAISRNVIAANMLLLHVGKIDLDYPVFLSRWALSLHSNPTERTLHP